MLLSMPFFRRWFGRAMKPATEVFGEWAKIGKDEGMERGHAQSVSEMLEFAEGKLKQNGKNFSAMDIGCGNGWVVRKISQFESCSLSVGVDGAKEMIEKAKAIDTDGEGIYHFGILPDWQPAEKFDFIHSMECFYYLNDPISFVKKVHDDWMNTGGWIVMGVDHYEENTDSLSWPEHVGVHMTTLSESQWIDAYKSAGFGDITAWKGGKKDGFVGTLIIAAKKIE